MLRLLDFEKWVGTTRFFTIVVLLIPVKNRVGYNPLWVAPIIAIFLLKREVDCNETGEVRTGSRGSFRFERKVDYNDPTVCVMVRDILRRNEVGCNKPHPSPYGDENPLNVVG